MGYRGIAPPVGFLPPDKLLPSSLPEKTPLCVALSGGADSVALLAMLADRENVSAVHVHHGIRGAEADRDAAFCRELTDKMGIPLTVLRIDAPSLAKARGLSLETAARDGRYEAICAHMQTQGIPVLATAHHADDQLETVLQHLLRGSGLSGLCGIPACRPLWDGLYVVRPLLSVTREELRAYLDACALPFVEDGTNSEPCCTRNRLRLSVIPLLKELYPAAAQSAARCADILTQDEAYLQGCAGEFLERTNGAPSTEALAALPDPIFARVLRQMLPVCPEKQHIALIRTFCERGVPHSSLSLPGCTLTVENGRPVLSTGPVHTSDYEVVLREGEQVIPGVGMALLTRDTDRQKNPFASLHTYTTQISLNSATIQGDLVLRNRRTGDRLYQGRMHKAVRRLAGLVSFPTAVRAGMPLLCDGDGILAVPFGRANGAPLYRDGTDPKNAEDLILYLGFD